MAKPSSIDHLFRIAFMYCRVQFLGWRFFIVSWVLDVAGMIFRIVLFFYAAVFGQVNNGPMDADRVSYVVLGAVAISFMGVGLSLYYQAYHEGYWSGAFDLHAHSPIGVAAYFVGAFLYRIVLMAIEVSIYLFMGGALLGTELLLRLWRPEVFIALFLGFMAASAFGMLAASSFTLLHSRGGSDPLSAVIGMVAPLFSGVYFPTSTIPRGLSWISALLPHTYVATAFRVLAQPGQAFADPAFVQSLSHLVLLIVAVGPLGVLALILSFRRARKTGELTLWM
ncbi:MAG: ABC transporter permease [Bacillota bacterium]